VAAADFWNNQAEAQKTLQRQRRLAEDIELRDSLQKKIDDIGVLIEWSQAGEDVTADLAKALDALVAQVETAETKKMLGGEHDQANAIVTIHPGAGGTESQDWAEMLLRMYLKWAERKGFTREILDYQPGEEAGLKSVTFTLSGEYAFGLMSAEAGVHRLVRISPFDQAARRHTSFASVYVWPEFDDEIEIDIPEKDLRIDTFRSSGAGGQHVNVTDSAVRLTHLPTGIVISCQNERSQHKNRDVAMKVLKARLYDLKQKEQQDKLSGLAAGLALEGHTVFTYSIGNFPTLRCLEQIRNDICYHSANVKIVCVGGGMSYGAVGMSHHATEDLAILRSLPGMLVFCMRQSNPSGQWPELMLN